MLRRESEEQIPKIPLSEKHVQHCAMLLDRRVMLSKLGPGGVVAEIGVDKGDFSELILDIAKPSRLHLIDTWGSERYHWGLYEGIRDRYSDLIARGDMRIHRKLSTEAAQDFDDDYFDWIYIDTDHSYSNTREELLRFAPKVKKHGIIAGHDYSMGNWAGSYRYGVIEAVHEFCVAQEWELLYVTAEPIENQSFAIRKIQSEN